MEKDENYSLDNNGLQSINKQIELFWCFAHVLKQQDIILWEQ